MWTHHLRSSISTGKTTIDAKIISIKIQKCTNTKVQRSELWSVDSLWQAFRLRFRRQNWVFSICWQYPCFRKTLISSNWRVFSIRRRIRVSGKRWSCLAAQLEWPSNPTTFSILGSDVFRSDHHRMEIPYCQIRYIF